MDPMQITTGLLLLPPNAFPPLVFRYHFCLDIEERKLVHNSKKELVGVGGEMDSF